jgi:hypothetical protein
MNDTVLTTIAITGFGVAFFHAAIPTHWLPFVLASRAQHWSQSKTLGVTVLAGSGHVLVTAALGMLIAWFGIALTDRIGAWFPRIAGAALLLLGAFYLYRQLTGKGTHITISSAVIRIRTWASWSTSMITRRRPSPHGARAVGPDRDHEPADAAHVFAVRGIPPDLCVGVRYGWAGFALLTAILSSARSPGWCCSPGSHCAARKTSSSACSRSTRAG